MGRRVERTSTRLTYHCWVDKSTPTALLLEESEDEGNDGRTEEDDDELVLELLENQLPDGGRGFFRDGCDTQVSKTRG